MSDARWAEDPSGRHDLRYWDGASWTEHVNDGGVPSVDPIDRETPSEAAAAPATTIITPPVPTLGPRGGKPIWKRWWAIAIAVVLLLGVVGSLLPDKKTSNLNAATAATTTTEFQDQSTTPAVLNADDDVTALPASASADPTTTPTAPPTTRAPRPTAPAPTSPPATADPYAGETVSQRNARKSAGDYLETTAFSRSGLINQLKYEGFSDADATYGTDAVHADWFEQAARMAQQYMDTTSFSRQGMIDQLKYEGFSQAEAEHGADSVGL